MERSTTHEGYFTGVDEAHPTEEILMGGSLAQTIAGGGAIVLSILGLLGMLPETLVAVAAIAIGGAFILESAAIGSRFTWLVTHATHTSFETGELGVGMTTEFVGGIAGVALGVLSLLGLVPGVLVPIAAIVFGFTLLFGAGVQARLNDLEMQCSTKSEMARMVSREAVSATSGMQMLFGLGAIALGIISLVHIAPLVLTLAAMLAVGGATLFSGTSLTARMWGFARFCELPHEQVKT